MKSAVFCFLFSLLCFLAVPGCYHYPPKGAVRKNETVICVHGLFDTVASMRPMAKHFSRLGYDVHVVPYSSTEEKLPGLIRVFSEKVAKLNISESDRPVHFIGHSMGGIIIRGYLNGLSATEGIGRIVTISTPHKGSPFADRFSQYSIPRSIVTPVSGLMTTGSESVIHMKNPASRFEVGTIAGGTGRVKGFYPEMGEDNDSVVPVSSTHLEEEKDHVRLPYTHSVIHWRRETLDQAANFIMHGEFLHE